MHIMGPILKKISQIFLPTPESLYIYAKLKTLEYEALELCFDPPVIDQSFQIYKGKWIKYILDFSIVFLEFMVMMGGSKTQL